MFLRFPTFLALGTSAGCQLGRAAPLSLSYRGNHLRSGSTAILGAKPRVCPLRPEPGEGPDVYCKETQGFFRKSSLPGPRGASGPLWGLSGPPGPGGGLYVYWKEIKTPQGPPQDPPQDPPPGTLRTHPGLTQDPPRAPQDPPRAPLGPPTTPPGHPRSPRSPRPKTTTKAKTESKT